MSTGKTHTSRRRWSAILGLGGVIALIGFSLLMEGRRRTLYWYDTASDYRYSFGREEVESFQVRLTDGGFIFPNWTREWQTALVRVDVRSRLWSSWFEPYIEIAAKSLPACRQRFERGARGARYVHLCVRPGDIAPGARIDLLAGHMELPEQTAEVLLFSSRPVETSRLLIVAPHPDDAEIAAFGLYAKRDSWVVTVTTGGYGGDRYLDHAPTRTERDSLEAELREWDSRVVPTLAGLTSDRVLNLGYFTTQLERMRADPRREVANAATGSTSVTRSRANQPMLASRPAVSTWENLVDDLAALIRRIQPQVIVFPHPVLDANRDHRYTAAAVLEALERIGDPAQDLLLYTNHHVLSEYYPFGPSDDVVTLPPWFSDSVPFRSLHSQRLDPGLQRAKMFALDAMHDLRPPPERVVGSVPGRMISRLIRAIGSVARDPALELSYMRRAVRPNELFFAYRGEDRKALQRLIPSGKTQGAADPTAPVASVRAAEAGAMTRPLDNAARH